MAPKNVVTNVSSKTLRSSKKPQWNVERGMIGPMHEAGHALVAWKQGRLIRENGVSVTPCGLGGNVHVHPLIRPNEIQSLGDLSFALVEREIELCLAGPVAEAIYLGSRLNGRVIGFDGPRGDNTFASELASTRYSKGLDCYVQFEMQRRVARKFRRPEVWSALMELAET